MVLTSDKGGLTLDKVLVFAERILPSTQTFIPLQVGQLKRYQAVYTGLIPPPHKAFPLAEPPILLWDKRDVPGRIRRELYRWTGVAPGYHDQLRKVGASMLHAHFSEGGPAALSLSTKLNLPLFLHMRGGAEMHTTAELKDHVFQWPFIAYRERLWKRATAFLCVSNFIRERAVANGFPADKVRVLYTGMNIERFTPKLPVEEKDPGMVLYVGRLVAYKGGDYLLRAMQIVQRSYPKARLVVIGDGEFRLELEKLNASLGVKAEFLGEMPQKEIHGWLDKARVFCGPSLTLPDGMSEAFGNVFSEAQAMGVPVVSFRHGGIPETMQDGVTGLLADERDTDTLAAHLLRFLTDDVFWANARQEGMRWVRDRFLVEKQTAQLEHLYDRAREQFRPDRFEQDALVDA